MSFGQILRETLSQGKCELVGHQISRAEMDLLVSGLKNSLPSRCRRCKLPLIVFTKGNKIKAITRY